MSTTKRTDNLRSLLVDEVGAKAASCILSDELSLVAQAKAIHELDSLYEEYTFASAKDASLTDDLQRRISNNNKNGCDHEHTEDSLVYGEIDLQGFCDLLMNHVPHSHNDVFYDLGSGSGKAVFAARFVGDFQDCVGIELLSNLHEMANSGVKSLYRFQYQHKLVHQDVRFVCSDLLNYDGWWKDGTDVYIPNLLFSNKLKDQIAEKAVKMRSGAFLICLKKFEGNAFNLVFDLIKERPVAMSWGESITYIYKRQ